MTGYGQFCAIARAHEVLGGRWTLLIVRELLCGSHRFNDIRRGIPRISRTVLSERLKELAEIGAITRDEGTTEYELTDAGRELAPLIGNLATWGQRWLPRHAETEDIDLDPILVDMQRRVRLHTLPTDPLIVRIEFKTQRPRFMLLRQSEASICHVNPGFPEPLRISGKLPPLAAWWRGDVEFLEARRAGLSIEGPRHLTRAFPKWFERYQFAHVKPISTRG
jgi:DNA-binding HxlR family transcriptional regulator